MSHWPLTLLHSIAAITKLIIPLVLVRLFPSELIGEYKVFFLFLYLAPELLGIGGIVNGLGFWSGDRDAKGLLSAATALTCAATLLAIPVALLAFQFGVIEFSDKSLLFAFLIYAVASLPRAVIEEILIVSGTIWETARCHLVAEFLRAIVLVCTAWSTGDLSIALLSAALVTLGEVGIYALIASKEKLLSVNTIRIQHLKSVLAYSVPLSIAGFATVCFEKCDQLFLSQAVSASEFAFYTLGCLVIPPLFVLEQSVTRVLVAELSRKKEEDKNGKQQANIYRSAILQIAFWAIPSSLFLICMAEPLVLLLYTDRYQESAQYLQLFAVSYLMLAFPVDVLPRAHGLKRWLFITHLVSGALSFLAVIVFGTTYGAMGALFALLLTQLLMRAYGTAYAAERMNCSLLDMIPLVPLTKVLLCSLCGVLALSLVTPMLSSEFFKLLAGFFTFSFGFLVLWYLFPARFRSQSRSEKRTVLQVTQFLTVGGLERVVTDLAVELQRSARWQSFVFSYDVLNDEDISPFTERLSEEGVSVTAIQKREGFCLRSLFALVDLIRRNRIEVLHSHDLGSLVYASLAKLLSFEPPVLIHTQHSFVHLNRERRYRTFERVFTLFADKVVCVGENISEIYREIGLSSKKLTVIENGVRFELEDDSSESTDEARRKALRDQGIEGEVSEKLLSLQNWIVYVGRIFPGKGQREALQIWQNLPKTLRENTALVFVGPRAHSDEVAYLESEVEALPDCENVFLVGSSQRTALWYRAASLCLSCSSFEGHPLVPIEALGNGAPFVASDIRGHSSLSKAAVLYQLRNPKAGALAISSLLLSFQSFPAFNAARQKRIEHSYREMYSFSSTREQYEQLYRSYLYEERKGGRVEQEGVIPNLQGVHS